MQVIHWSLKDVSSDREGLSWRKVAEKLLENDRAVSLGETGPEPLSRVFLARADEQLELY